MSEFDQNEEVDEGFAHDIKMYIEHRIQLFSITITEQISAVIAESIQKVIALLMICGGLLILWMSLGFYLGSILQSYGAGFFIAALPLLLSGILFYRIRFRRLENQIQADLLSRLPFGLDDETNKQENESNGEK